MMDSELTFHSAWYCPFAQRTWAALEYLDVPYVYKETDPYHKTDCWLWLSRETGQVPVLQLQSAGQTEMRVPGSLRTLDFLDEISNQRRNLYPDNSQDRADARFWLDHLSTQIVPYFYRFLKAEAGSEAAEIAKTTMVAGLEAITKAMTTSGPYFLGAEPDVVDFALAPFAARIELLLSHYKGFRLPKAGAVWDRYWIWSQAIQTHPVFLATMPDPETYKARLLEFYLPYSRGDGQKDVTEVA